MILISGTALIFFTKLSDDEESEETTFIDELLSPFQPDEQDADTTDLETPYDPEGAQDPGGPTGPGGTTEPEGTAPKGNIWTTFFYVAFDNNIGEWDSWASDLHYLEKIGPPNNGALVALVDEEYEGDSYILIIEEGYSTPMPTWMINIDWGSEVNMGDPNTLYEFLAWGISNFPSDHYDIHLMDHGGAWMGVCSDDTSGDFLDAWEIRDAFNGIKQLIGRNIDIVSCDACLMGNFEFAYEISDSVDYLTACETYGIGSSKEENFFYTGNWLYEEVWGGLKENPHWTPEEFALHQLDCFLPIGPFVSPDSGIYWTESSDTFVVVDLTRISPLKDALTMLADELYMSVEGVGEGQTLAERQMILEVVGHSESPPELNTESFSGELDFIGMATYTIYDLGDLVDRLIDYGSLLCSEGTAREVKNRLDDVIVGCVHGNDRTLGEHPDAHGLSIYIPYRMTEYMPSYESTRFAQESLWDEFLKDVNWSEF